MPAIIGQRAPCHIQRIQFDSCFVWTVGKTMEYECSWIGQGERLVDSRRKNGASKKEDNKYIPLETMIELGLIKLVQVSAVPYYILSHYISAIPGVWYLCCVDSYEAMRNNETYSCKRSDPVMLSLKPT